MTLIPRQDLRLAIRNQTANDGHDVRDAASLVHCAAECRQFPA